MGADSDELSLGRSGRVETLNGSWVGVEGLGQSSPLRAQASGCGLVEFDCLVEAVDAALGIDFGGVPAGMLADVVPLMASVLNRVQAVDARFVEALDASGVWARRGHRNVTAMLSCGKTHRTPHPAAHAHCQQATQTLPAKNDRIPIDPNAKAPNDCADRAAARFSRTVQEWYLVLPGGVVLTVKAVDADSSQHPNLHGETHRRQYADPMKSHHLPALDSVLCYFEFGGDGCPLLFIHGLGCASSFDFPPVVTTPRLRGRHAVLVDLLGSGYSDHPDNFSYRIRSHAETILHFIRTKGFKRTVLVGHSMGGAVAIQVATSLKTDIQGLILLEPNLDSGGGLFSKAAANLSESEYVAEGHLDSILEAESSGNEAWATTMRSSYPPGVHRAAASLVEGGSPPWRKQLEALTVPRTVIFGDRSLPDPDVGQLPEHGIATMVVQDAGHALAIDSPDGLAKAIDEALVLI